MQHFIVTMNEIIIHALKTILKITQLKEVHFIKVNELNINSS